MQRVVRANNAKSGKDQRSSQSQGSILPSWGETSGEVLEDGCLKNFITKAELFHARRGRGASEMRIGNVAGNDNESEEIEITIDHLRMFFEGNGRMNNKEKKKLEQECIKIRQYPQFFKKMETAFSQFKDEFDLGLRSNINLFRFTYLEQIIPLVYPEKSNARTMFFLDIKNYIDSLSDFTAVKEIDKKQKINDLEFVLDLTSETGVKDFQIEGFLNVLKSNENALRGNNSENNFFLKELYECALKNKDVIRGFLFKKTEEVSTYDVKGFVAVLELLKLKINLFDGKDCDTKRLVELLVGEPNYRLEVSVTDAKAIYSSYEIGMKSGRGFECFSEAIRVLIAHIKGLTGDVKEYIECGKTIIEEYTPKEPQDRLRVARLVENFKGLQCVKEYDEKKGMDAHKAAEELMNKEEKDAEKEAEKAARNKRKKERKKAKAKAEAERIVKKKEAISEAAKVAVAATVEALEAAVCAEGKVAEAKAKAKEKAAENAVREAQKKQEQAQQISPPAPESEPPAASPTVALPVPQIVSGDLAPSVSAEVAQDKAGKQRKKLDPKAQNFQPSYQQQQAQSQQQQQCHNQPIDHESEEPFYVQNPQPLDVQPQLLCQQPYFPQHNQTQTQLVYYPPQEQFVVHPQIQWQQEDFSEHYQYHHHHHQMHVVPSNVPLPGYY
jgi:hypothetical protein